MIIIFIISIVTSFCLGFQLVNRLIALKTPFFSSLWWVKFFLSTGIGIGISSVLFVFFRYTFQFSATLIFLIEIVLLLVTIIHFYLFKAEVYLPKYHSQSNGRIKIIELIFFMLLAVSMGAFIYQSILNPHGGWDAWAIWNLHAKFISAGQQGWQNLFSPYIYWSHPDYPLLTPGIISKNWELIKNNTQIVPITIALIFTFGTVGLLVSTIRFFKGWLISSLIGISLLGTASFVQLGASQYADIPLGFFMLSTLVLLLLYEKHTQHTHGKKSILILVGLSAGFAGWTKNEGLLFLIVFLSSRFVISIWNKNIKTYFKELIHIGKGLIPMALIIVYFKLRIAPRNDLFNDSLAQILKKLTDIERYIIIIKKFINEFVLGGNGLVLVLVIVLLLAKGKLDKEIKKGVQMCFLVVILMLAGYFSIYIITPKPLEWHLSTSLQRIAYQLLPSMLLTVSMFLSPYKPNLPIKNQ